MQPHGGVQCSSPTRLAYCYISNHREFTPNPMGIEPARLLEHIQQPFNGDTKRLDCLSFIYEWKMELETHYSLQPRTYMFVGIYNQL